MQRKKFVNNELIGKMADIISSKNKTLVGMRGKIVDESKNLVTIQTNNKLKKIIKNAINMKIDNLVIEGEKTIGNIEERIKKNG